MSRQKKSHTDTIGKPNDNITRQTRRGALRKILAAGGVIAGAQTLPNSWKKPIIESVVLPAHAGTSDVKSETGTIEDEAQTTTGQEITETTTVPA